MPINLSKGQKVDLTKGNPGLKNVMVGLGWDVNAFDSGADFDLDAAAFMVDSNGKCPTEKEFVFYGNLEHPSGAIKHMGDNRTGDGEGDDEQIEHQNGHQTGEAQLFAKCRVDVVGVGDRSERRVTLPKAGAHQAA